MPIEPTVECVPCKKQNPIGSVSCFNCGFPLDPELAGVDPLSFAKTMSALRGIGPQVQDLKVVISISRGQDSFVSLWRKKCKNHLRRIWDQKTALRPHPRTIQERWDRDHWYRFQMMAQGWSRSFLAVVETEALSPGDQTKKNVDFKTRQKWWGGKVEIRSCQSGGRESQPRRLHDDYETFKKRKTILPERWGNPLSRAITPRASGKCYFKHDLEIIKQSFVYVCCSFCGAKIFQKLRCGKCSQCAQWYCILCLDKPWHPAQWDHIQHLIHHYGLQTSDFDESGQALPSALKRLNLDPALAVLPELPEPHKDSGDDDDDEKDPPFWKKSDVNSIKLSHSAKGTYDTSEKTWNKAASSSSTSAGGDPELVLEERKRPSTYELYSEKMESEYLQSEEGRKWLKTEDRRRWNQPRTQKSNHAQRAPRERALADTARNSETRRQKDKDGYTADDYCWEYLGSGWYYHRYWQLWWAAGKGYSDEWGSCNPYKKQKR